MLYYSLIWGQAEIVLEALQIKVTVLGIIIQSFSVFFVHKSNYILTKVLNQYFLSVCVLVSFVNFCLIFGIYF